MMSKQAARRPGRRSSQSQSYHRAAMAAATSWPTQKAGRHTSEPVLACPTSGPSRHSRSTCASSPPPAGMQSRSASPWQRRKRRQQRTRNVPRLGVFKFVRSTRGAPSWSTWTSMTKAAAAPHEILVSLPLPKFVQFFHKLNPSPNPKP